MILAFAIAGIVTFIGNLIFALFIYYESHNSKANLFFALFFGSVSMYGFGFFMQAISQTACMEMISIKVLLCGTILIPYFFIRATYAIIRQKIKKPVVFAMLLLCVFFEFINFFTNLFANEPIPKFGLKYVFQAGTLYPLLMLSFGIGVIISLTKLYMAYHQSIGIERNRLKYLFFGMVVGFMGGSVGFMIGYDINLFPWNPYTSYTVFLGNLMIAYAIVKHRLLNIDLVHRQVWMFILYLGIVLTIFIPVVIFLKLSYIFLLLLIIAIGISPFLYKFIVGKLKPVFYGKKFGYLDKLGKGENSKPLYTSSDVAEYIVDKIYKSMNVVNCSFMMYDSWREQYRPKTHQGLDGVLGDFQIIPVVAWGNEEPIIKYLEGKKGVLIKEEIEREGDIKGVLSNMNEIKAEVIVPVFIEYKLISVIGIGKKKTGDIFDSVDVKALKELAINVRQDLSHTHFMEERTVFSSKVAHDLRSPFGWILNALYDTKEGIRGELNFEQKKVLEEIFESTRILELNIRTFFNLNVLLQRVMHGEYETQKANIRALMEKARRRFEVSAEKLGVKIELEFKPDIPVFYVVMNVEDIESHVLDNLIINALKYTKNGKLVFGLELKGDEVICKVQDTGIGIPRQSLPHVFEPFFHLHTAGEDKQKGTGLGLVIVKEVVEANKGNVWVESEEEVGTTFYFTLPLAKKVQEVGLVQLEEPLFKKKERFPKIRDMVNILEKMKKEEYRSNNIIKGRLCFLTQDAVGLGDYLRLSIILPNRKETAIFTSKVVWVGQSEEKKDAYEIGVYIIDITPNMEKDLLAYIKSL